MPRKNNLHLTDPEAHEILIGQEVPIPEESEATTHPEQRFGEGKRLTFGPEIKRTGRSPERR